MPNNIEEQIKDFEGTKQAEILLKMGISPKGVTGCNACDLRRFIYCKCEKGGGKKEDGGSEDAYNSDKDDTLDDKFGSKALKNSAPLATITNNKIGKTPELTLFLENSNGKNLSDEEIQALTKIFSKIVAAFKEFVQELKDKGVSIKNYVCHIENAHTNPVLKLHIPDAKHQDEFIQRMMYKKLWPVPTPDQQKLEPENPKNKYQSPNPFNTKLTPFSTK